MRSAMRMGWFVAQLVIDKVFDLKKNNSMDVVFFSQFDAYKNIYLLIQDKLFNIKTSLHLHAMCCV